MADRMTLDQAIRVRTSHLSGEPVPALVLQAAIQVIADSRPHRGRPYKFRLPKLTQADRDRMNGMLMFNLGRLAGREQA